MSNSFGKHFKISIYGESHGQGIGVMIDGLPAGIEIDFDQVNADLSKRKAQFNFSTARREVDEYQLISGYFNGTTNGTPLLFNIENKDTRSKDYQPEIMRPSHSDYPMYIKHRGYNDYRGGGASSARISAPLVIAGSIARSLLAKKNIHIGSHILQINHLKDESFTTIDRKTLERLENDLFPVLGESIKGKMLEHINSIQRDLDSVGGIIQTAAINLPIGIGEPFFDSLESYISHLLFSIPSVKGVSFGLGFDFVHTTGIQANDSMSYNQGIISFQSNNNGGILGGLTTGEPLILQTVLKPIPSIRKTQQTINIQTKETIDYTITGRHDVTQINRAIVIINSVVAIAILDLLIELEGKSWMI